MVINHAKFFFFKIYFTYVVFKCDSRCDFNLKGVVTQTWLQIVFGVIHNVMQVMSMSTRVTEAMGWEHKNNSLSSLLPQFWHPWPFLAACRKFAPWLHITVVTVAKSVHHPSFCFVYISSVYAGCHSNHVHQGKSGRTSSCSRWNKQTNKQKDPRRLTHVKGQPGRSDSGS